MHCLKTSDSGLSPTNGRQMLIILVSRKPFTPKSDQVRIFPTASPEISHHTVSRIAYSDWKIIIVPILSTPRIHFSLKGCENVLFELGSERVKLQCSFALVPPAFAKRRLRSLPRFEYEIAALFRSPGRVTPNVVGHASPLHVGPQKSDTRCPSYNGNPAKQVPPSFISTRLISRRHVTTSVGILLPPQPRSSHKLEMKFHEIPRSFCTL